MALLDSTSPLICSIGPRASAPAAGVLGSADPRLTSVSASSHPRGWGGILSMAGFRRATSANSSPGPGGRCDGRALGREGKRRELSLDAPLTPRPPPSFLPLNDSTMHSHTQPPTGAPSVHPLTVRLLTLMSPLLSFPLSPSLQPALTSSLPISLWFMHPCIQWAHRALCTGPHPISQTLDESLVGSQSFRLAGVMVISWDDLSYRRHRTGHEGA